MKLGTSRHGSAAWCFTRFTFDGYRLGFGFLFAGSSRRELDLDRRQRQRPDELLHAGEALFATITSACREVAPDLDETFDHEAWADVLTELLRPARPAVSGACEVHDIEMLRMTWMVRRGAIQPSARSGPKNISAHSDASTDDMAD